MSLPKAQLVDPQGNMNLPGMTATGIVTASSLKGVTTGTATGLTGNPDLDVGIVTASSFVGQGDGHAANLTGTPQLNLGVTTSTGFIGDAVGKAAGLTGTPNLNVGLITATSFVGFVTGNVTGNISGLAASITPGANLGVGVCTAIQYHGDGSGLVGAGSSAYIAQNITGTGAETIIDLSYGNVIYYTSSSNTTVGFASTSAAEQITFIRDAGNSYTITWPDRVKWNNGTTPPLFNQTGSYQIFRLTTVDTGLKYNAWEDSKSATVSGLFVSGNNAYGQLAQNNNIKRSSPVQIPGTTWSLLPPTFRSANGSIAAKPAGTIWMWGYQGAGEFGQNSPTIRYSSPVQVPGTNWGYAAHGEIGTLAAKTNGTLWAWGTSRYGNLGLNQGPGNDHSSPTQIGTDTSWGYVRGTLTNGYQHNAAIKTSGGTTGTLWAWGRNFYGSLGLNEGAPTPGYPGSKSSPTQVGTNNTWYRIWNGSNLNTAAIKNDASLWMWGYAELGVLGLNDQTQRSSPCQVPGSYQRCFLMDNSLVATKTNNTLWAWGYNNYGQLGQNGPVNTHQSSPVQIPGSWDKDSLELAGQAAWVAKKVGSDVLWGNGINHEGQLGQNNNTYYSSPVQIHSAALTEYGQVSGNVFGKILPDPFY